MPKSIVVYGHRRRPPQALDVPQLADLPHSDPDKREISFAEMARRMKKRSHPATLSAPDLHDNEHSLKKTRYNMSMFDKGDVSTAEVFDGRPALLFASQNQNVFSSQNSGVLSDFGRHYMRPALLSHQQSQEGTLPEFFSRKSLHNSTELNPGLGAHLDLASPFNSHPNSRAPSPSKKTKTTKIKRARTKSRTLSAHLAENEGAGSPTENDPLTASAAPSRKKLKTKHHSRNPSVPSIGNASPHDWLIQAQAFSRSSSFRPEPPTIADLSLEPQQGPIFSPSSFINDNPVAFSTPVSKRPFLPQSKPDRRHAAPRFSVAQLDLPVSVEKRYDPPLCRYVAPHISVAQLSLPVVSPTDKCHDLPFDPDIYMADLASTPEPAPPPHIQEKRRRIRLSGDSICSSIVESLSVPASSRPEISVPKHDTLHSASAIENHSSTRSMSLTSIFDPSASDKGLALAPAISLSSKVSLTVPSGSKPSGTVDRQGLPILDGSVSSSPDLLDLFKIRDDSDLVTAVFADMTLNKDKAIRDIEPSFDRTHSLPTGRNKEGSRSGRRKRRDTIRASDSRQGHVEVKAAPTKKASGRMRSGTVTQSSYQASMQTRLNQNGQIVRIDDGLPLSPQRDDDSDDELLLITDGQLWD